MNPETVLSFPDIRSGGTWYRASYITRRTTHHFGQIVRFFRAGAPDNVASAKHRATHLLWKYLGEEIFPIETAIFVDVCLP